MSSTEELRYYRDSDPNAPESYVCTSTVDGEHGLHRAAYWIGGQYATLMHAPLDGNGYPVWADATEVDTDQLAPWLAEVAERAEFRVRTAQPCDECGTPAGRRCDDYNCQSNWW